jgi:hypothetical protein
MREFDPVMSGLASLLLERLTLIEEASDLTL